MLDLSKLPGARRAFMPTKFTPMLASLPDGPFSRSNWIYEPKMDGMRAITIIADGKARLMSRRSLEITNQYPSLARELTELVPCDVMLDGEIIALNEQGKPSFQHLQQRMNLLRTQDISRAEQSVPAYYFIFDIVFADGYDVCGMKLSDRKALLKGLVSQSTNVRLLTHFEEDGVAAYEVCVENGFEGIVAKRLDSPYEPGRRSAYWTKVKAQQTDEFVVGGYTQGQGSRSPTFGALLLGAYDDKNNLIYCGSVGSGFDERLLRDMIRRMEPHKQSKFPFLKRPDEKKEVTWLKPEIVVEIKFMDWTRDGHLRTPVFLRVRDDKVHTEIKLEKRAPQAITKTSAKVVASKSETISVEAKIETVKEKTKKSSGKNTRSKVTTEESIIIETSTSSLNIQVTERASLMVAETVETYKTRRETCHSVAAQLAASHEERMEIVADGDTLELTHLNKILWTPYEGLPKLTKRDLLRYICLVAPYSLEYLKDRPFSVVRSPYGMRGKRFYQKHWNFQIPDYVETCFVERSNDAETEVAMCNNFASLLWFTQNGVMEHHVWLAKLSREDEGNKPDFMAFDLDLHFEEEKKDARTYREDAFLRVSEAAVWLKEALDSVSLVPYLKTSGRNGLHVFVPIENSLTHDEVRALAETITKFIIGKHADKVSLDAVTAKRDGKIYVDASPNCRGKTLVAPYSPRLVREQTVSTPLEWKELGQALPVTLTMQSVPERLKESGDLWGDWPQSRRNLESILGKK